MPRKPLTPKQREFVRHYTNEKDKTTHLNGVQSALKAFNVNSPESAGVRAHTVLKNVNVAQAIERRILKKEDIQSKLATMQEKIEEAVNNGKIDPEIVPLIRENREYLLAHAKVNGDLIDRVQNLNVNVDRNKDLAELSDRELQEEVMKRMMQGPSDE